jgi:hypothetical protein
LKTVNPSHLLSLGSRFGFIGSFDPENKCLVAKVKVILHGLGMVVSSNSTGDYPCQEKPQSSNLPERRKKNWNDLSMLTKCHKE